MFNEPLDVFYDNVFYLSYLGHLTVSDIHNMSPGEYTYFVRRLEQTNGNQNSNSDSSEEMVETEANFNQSELFGEL